MPQLCIDLSSKHRQVRAQIDRTRVTGGSRTDTIEVACQQSRLELALLTPRLQP